MARAAAVTIALSALLLSSACGTSSDERTTLRVFAAASLTDVLEAIVDSFEMTIEGAPEVQLNIAGSSLLARQIEHGAGAAVFVSAHPSWTSYLHERGFLGAAVELPISNRLVLVSRESGRRLINVERLALADPEHVPAGMYARKALECEQLWRSLEPRTTATVDVRAALAAVEAGAVDAAIVYGSDARFAPELYAAEVVSPGCAPMITYTVGLSPAAGEGAELFAAYLSDTLRGKLWRSFGFTARAGNDTGSTP